MRKFALSLLVATLAFSTNLSAQRFKESFSRADSTFESDSLRLRPGDKKVRHISFVYRFPAVLRCPICNQPFKLGDNFVYYVTKVEGTEVEAQYAHYLCTTRRPAYEPKRP